MFIFEEEEWSDGGGKVEVETSDCIVEVVVEVVVMVEEFEVVVVGRVEIVCNKSRGGGKRRSKDAILGIEFVVCLDVMVVSLSLLVAVWRGEG